MSKVLLFFIVESLYFDCTFSFIGELTCVFGLMSCIFRLACSTSKVDTRGGAFTLVDCTALYFLSALLVLAERTALSNAASPSPYLYL